MIQHALLQVMNAAISHRQLLQLVKDHSALFDIKLAVQDYRERKQASRPLIIFFPFALKGGELLIAELITAGQNLAQVLALDIGHLFALLSACFGGAAAVMMRSLSGVEKPTVLMLSTSTFMFLASLPIALITFTMPSLTIWLAMLACVRLI